MVRRTAPVLALLVLLLAGCTGGSSDSASSTSSGGAVADTAGGSGAAVGAPPAKGEAASPGIAPATLVVSDRDVVRTGDLSVAVDAVAAAADEAGRLARAAGGTVESDERTRDGADAKADVRLRIPPQAFDGVLSRVAGLGTETGRSLGSQDVTDTVVDLQARLDSQRASVARVRALLDRASTLGEVVSVEGQLTKRTSDLEALEARVAAVRAQVDLSTLTVHLVARHHVVESYAPGPRGFGDGLRAGWKALVATGRAVALVVGALLPFSPLLLLAGGAVLVTHRRRHRPASS